MRRGELLAAWRSPVAVMFLLSLCIAVQAASPRPASAQPPPRCVGGGTPQEPCPSLASTFNNVGIIADRNARPPAPGAPSFDGSGENFFSQGALVAAGAAPGALIVSRGVTFTFPNVAAGDPDNTVVQGQTIKMSGSGTLGFLASAGYGDQNNLNLTQPGTIRYTDGSSQTYTFTGANQVNNWWDTGRPGWSSSTAVLAINSAYQNRRIDNPANRYNNIPFSFTSRATIFCVTVPLQPGKAVASVTLPTGLSLTAPAAPGFPGNNIVHVFAMATTTALLSQDRPATASSVQSTCPMATGCMPGNAVDGDLSTRWGSEYGPEGVLPYHQWLQVDLGTLARIDHVTLVWERAYATAFTIQTSNDGETWTTISPQLSGASAQWSTGTVGEGVGTQVLSYSVSGRYVRVDMTARRNFGSPEAPVVYGYSLWEFQVFGTAAAPVLSPDVSVGNNHACATVGAQLYCWGNNRSGELGTGGTAPSFTRTAAEASAFNTSQVPSQVPSQVTAGNRYTCALNTAYRAYCWGRNVHGELGTSGNQVNPTPVPTPGAPQFYGRVSASYNGNHTCAVNAMKEAYCWGRNNFGQLGNDTTGGGPTPVPVTVLTSNTTTSTTGASRSRLRPTFNRVSVGTDHTCGVAATGYAYCWGNNTDDKLGCDTTINPACPSPTTIPPNYTNVPVAVDTSGVLRDKTVTEISAGDLHTCALDSDGNAYCWGDNSYGQLGNGTPGGSSNVPVAVSAPATGRWAQITAGSGFTCALTTLGRAYCWGRSDEGQLGTGFVGAHYPDDSCVASPAPACPVPVPVMITTGMSEGIFLTQISSGYSSTCVMDRQSNVYCWGLSEDGQLGYGSRRSSSVPVQVIFNGVLMIEVPGVTPLSPATPGGEASGVLGSVLVIDNRPTAEAEWEAEVSASDFTETEPPWAGIPATRLIYAIPSVPSTISPFSDVDGAEPISDVPPEGLRFGPVTTPPTELPNNAEPVVTGDGTYRAAWTPTITVAVPWGAAAGEYTATIYHSVY